MTQKPAIAVLTPNTLAGIGLKTILDKVIPLADVELFADFEEFREAGAERFFHYFVSLQLFRLHAEFFAPLRRRVILLTSGMPHEQEEGLHTINVCDKEEQLIHGLMVMHRGAHPHRGMDETVSAKNTQLTEREIEVLRLITRGRINKEIAEELGIGLTTVITHRRNIMEKLRMRSLAELVLYAIRAGYIGTEAL